MYQRTRSNLPVLVILGETASGKSKLAINLARRLNGEIICADSWTVRRGLNIGTDKPSMNDCKAVPHHLLDIIGPDEDFTAAVFKTLANQAIEDIHSRNRLPIMVGGSGLYIDSVIFDYKFLKPGDRNLRDKLNQLNVNELVEKIGSLGLDVDETVDRRNKRRLIRLIESGGVKPQKSALRDNTLLIGVKLPEDKLLESIEKRTDAMMSIGLEAEVRALADQYGWEAEGLKGVGYKQWRGYIEGHQSIEETRLQIISATNNLAKKQRTWFKRNKSIHWFIQPVNIDSIVDLVTTELAT
jgi:tRNA dimethylallyltransferase